MKALKKYDLKITVLSPIHVGCEKKLNKKEYIRLFENNLVIIPDIKRMYQDIRDQNLTRRFEEFMLQENYKDLEGWLCEVGFKPEDYKRWEKYHLNAVDAFIKPSNGKEASPKNIVCFMKDPYGLPYVPGSSVKGMIRSALLVWEMEKHSAEFSHMLQKLDDISYKGKSDDVEQEIRNIEVEAFHKKIDEKIKLENAVCSCMAGLRVSDSAPIARTQLTLSQKIDYSLQGRELVKPVLRETLKPGTEIYFSITIDAEKCNYTIEHILNALNLFQEYSYDYFYSRFGRGCKKDGIVWLGGGVGFPSKTIIYPAYKDQAYRIADQMFRMTMTKQLYSDHKHTRNAQNKLAPHVCKCTHYHGKLYDMGMGQIELLR